MIQTAGSAAGFSQPISSSSDNPVHPRPCSSCPWRRRTQPCGCPTATRTAVALAMMTMMRTAAGGMTRACQEVSQPAAAAAAAWMRRVWTAAAKRLRCCCRRASPQTGTAPRTVRRQAWCRHLVLGVSLVVATRASRRAIGCCGPFLAPSWQRCSSGMSDLRCQICTHAKAGGEPFPLARGCVPARGLRVLGDGQRL